ncbi:hypothetical protein ABPG77_007940 [Micractinium sp. CCAP 211/92]
MSGSNGGYTAASGGARPAVLEIDEEEFEDITLLLEAEQRQQRRSWWARTRARLPAWLRPGGQQAYRFHRLSTEEGLQQGGSRGADDAGEEEEGAGGGAPREGSAGEHRPAGRWCPEEQAGFLSRLTFSYVGGLIRLGYRKTLNFDDLWDVAAEDGAASVSDAFQWSLAGADGVVWRAMWRTHGRTFIIGTPAAHWLQGPCRAWRPCSVLHHCCCSPWRQLLPSVGHAAALPPGRPLHALRNPGRKSTLAPACRAGRHQGRAVHAAWSDQDRPTPCPLVQLGCGSWCTTPSCSWAPSCWSCCSNTCRPTALVGGHGTAVCCRGAAFGASASCPALPVSPAPRRLAAWLDAPPRPPTAALVGLALAAGLAAASVVETLTVNAYFHLLFRICLHLKIGLVDALYRKSLRISSAARAEHGAGKIVNLQSNDAAKLWSIPQYLHMIWSGPFQILVVMALLVRIIHLVPALAGLGATLALIPLSTLVGRAMAAVRKELVAYTDARVKLCTEVITGIKAIKLYAWEEPYVQRISKLREAELKQIRKATLLGTVNNLVFGGGPIIISLAALMTYSALGYPLTASVAFPALSLFNLLRFPVMMFPQQIMNLINGKVALDRIQKFMQAEEMAQRTPLPPAGPGQAAVEVVAGSFAWAAGDAPLLHDIDLAVPRGALVIVVGSVGCGKSSLLSALLGEMAALAGSVVVRGSTAYTQQDPWIQNATLRDNILMGAPLEQGRYDAVLDACALRPDLEMLPAGDQTEIGEKGVNLSGGQRHRVALARACYAAADVYLLDDPLSAVDAHVGRHLFDLCISGLLSKATRILVTHQLQYLPAADHILVLRDGRLAERGSYDELVARGVDFHQFEVASAPTSEEEEGPKASAAGEAANHGGGASAVATHNHSAEEQEGVRRSAEQQPESPSNGALANGVPDSDGWADGQQVAAAGGDAICVAAETAAVFTDVPLLDEQAASDGTAVVSSSRRSVDANGHTAAPKPVPAVGPTRATLAAAALGKPAKQPSGQLTKAEERAVGQVDRQVYLAYFRSWSPLYWIPILVLTLGLTERGLQAFQNFWLSIWSEATAAAEAGGDAAAMRTHFYMLLYFAFGLSSLAFQVVKAVMLVIGSVNAARVLQERLLSCVVRLPMSFFDSQPTGRLLNRFTKDTESVDVALQSSVSSFLNCAISVLWSLIVVVAVSPGILAAILPLTLSYYYIQTRYIRSSREIKRLDSLALSPIFGHFGETLQGLVTVRAFQQQASFEQRNCTLLDGSNRAWWPAQCINRWLSVRLELLGISVVFGTAVLVAVAAQRSAGLAGLALTSALNLTGLCNWMVRQTTELEVNMNSVERMVEYTALQPEAPAVLEARRPLPNWPQQGSIQVERLVVRYRPELDPVLKGITFSVRGREKIGVAGRTGCGKSTLMMALYRIVEPSDGRIVIDGIDTASIGLYDLRSRLALVPQDPVIFSGSVRSNLDPFGDAGSDERIWGALSQAGLADAVRGMPGGLDAPIAEGGGNLSVGQRQLLCMARALLRAARILVLDEATSNVDTASDALIQTTIATAFADCTVLTIAHRLHTIMDSDRILVLHEGTVREYDTPSNLLAQPGSAFRGMVEETARHRAHGSSGNLQATQSAKAAAALAGGAAV